MSKIAIWLPLLRLTTPTEKFPWDDLRKIFHGCQRIAKVPNDVETLLKISKTDDRRTGDNIGEREREFTFAENYNCVGNWDTMWHRLHNRLNPFTQFISFLPHDYFFVICPKDGGPGLSWSVDLSGGGVSISFCPGVEGSEKMRSTPPLRIYVINCVSTQAARFVLISLKLS